MGAPVQILDKGHSPFNHLQTMDSIWDGPAVPASAPLFQNLDNDGHRPAPTNASEPLFFEDTGDPVPRPRGDPKRVDDDMEDLFASFDDIAPPTQPLNVDALMQKARAKLDAEKRASNTSTATREQPGEPGKNKEGSKSKDGNGQDNLDQKSRRVIAKVDDER